MHHTIEMPFGAFFCAVVGTGLAFQSGYKAIDIRHRINVTIIRFHLQYGRRASPDGQYAFAERAGDVLHARIMGDHKLRIAHNDGGLMKVIGSASIEDPFRIRSLNPSPLFLIFRTTHKDDRVRDEHLDAPAGVGGEKRRIDEPFSNGLQEPSEPNCRCTLLYSVEDSRERAAPALARAVSV